MIFKSCSKANDIAIFLDVICEIQFLETLAVDSFTDFISINGLFWQIVWFLMFFILFDSTGVVVVLRLEEAWV